LKWLKEIVIGILVTIVASVTVSLMNIEDILNPPSTDLGIVNIWTSDDIVFTVYNQGEEIADNCYLFYYDSENRTTTKGPFNFPQGEHDVTVELPSQIETGVEVTITGKIVCNNGSSEEFSKTFVWDKERLTKPFGTLD
jgi:hypothetical protein